MRANIYSDDGKAVKATRKMSGNVIELRLATKQDKRCEGTRDGLFRSFTVYAMTNVIQQGYDNMGGTYIDVVVYITAQKEISFIF